MWKLLMEKAECSSSPPPPSALPDTTETGIITSLVKPAGSQRQKKSSSTQPPVCTVGTTKPLHAIVLTRLLASGIYGRLCCKPRGRGGGWTVLLNACETANGWRTRKNKWREMPYHRPPMRDDARAHDSAELTGVDCGDGEAGWRPERGWAEADRSSLCCYCCCC